MKICLDARYKVKSGSSSYVLNLVPAMVRQESGHEFILLKYATQQFEFEGRMAKVVNTPENDLLHMLWTCFVLPIKLRLWKADVFHSMKMPGPFWMGARTVNTMHSIFKPYKGSFPVSLKTRLYTFLFANAMIRRSHRLIAVSNFVSDCLTEVYEVEPERIDTIYHGVGNEFGPCDKQEVSEYLAAKSLPQQYVLCVGNVFAVKNHLTAVRAFAESGVSAETHLVIAGKTNDSYAENVVNEIEKLGLQGRVHLLGFVAGHDLSMLLNGAYCLLFPSLTEGFGVTLLEAFQCGLPVIASKRGSLWELGQGVALFVDDPMDASGFASKIDELFGNPILRDELSIAVQAEAGKYSWQASAKSHLECYEKACGTLPQSPG